MSIQDLGALGEFCASIAVLITLIILTIQLRSTKLALRRSSVRQSAADHAKAIDGVRNEAEIFTRGIEDLDVLDPVERLRFDLAMFNWLQAIEQAFADFYAGYIDIDCK